MDLTQIISTVSATAICACAAILFKISIDMAGFKEWRKHVNATLAKHGKDIAELKK